MFSGRPGDPPCSRPGYLGPIRERRDSSFFERAVKGFDRFLGFEEIDIERYLWEEHCTMYWTSSAAGDLSRRHRHQPSAPHTSG